MSTPNFSMIKEHEHQQCARDFYGFASANGIMAMPALTKDSVNNVGAPDQWNLDYPPNADSGAIYRIDVNVAATESKHRWAEVVKELRAFYGVSNSDTLPVSVEKYFDIPQPKRFFYVITNPPLPKTRVGKQIVDVYYQINGQAQDGELLVEGSNAYRCVPFNLQFGGEVERSFSRAWKKLT